MKEKLSAIRNLVSSVFFGETDWEACDIPTREKINEFMKEAEKVFRNSSE